VPIQLILVLGVAFLICGGLVRALTTPKVREAFQSGKTAVNA